MGINNVEKFVIITRVVLIVVGLASCASQSFTLETGDMDRIVFQDRATLSDSVLPDNSVLVASVGSSPNLTEMSLGVRHYSWGYKQDGLWMAPNCQEDSQALTLFVGYGGSLGFCTTDQVTSMITPGGPGRGRGTEYQTTQCLDLPISLYGEVGLRYPLSRNLGLSVAIRDSITIVGDSSENVQTTIGLNWSH